MIPRRMFQIALPVAAGVIFIGLWYAVHGWLSEDWRFLLPTPDAIFAALREHSTTLGRATVNTTIGALLGFLAAAAISALFAVMLSISPLIRASLYPYLMALQMTPVIVVAPILVLWVGAGIKSVVIITFLICFFPIVVNATQGLISTDRNHLELFKMWRTSRTQQLIHLRIPGALPYFFTGLRIAATLAPIGALVGDYTAGSSAGDGGGLGFQAVIFSSQAKYAALFATAAVTCALGFLFVAIVVALSSLTLRHWHESYEQRDT